MKRLRIEKVIALLFTMTFLVTLEASQIVSQTVEIETEDKIKITFPSACTLVENGKMLSDMMRDCAIATPVPVPFSSYEMLYMLAAWKQLAPHSSSSVFSIEKINTFQLYLNILKGVDFLGYKPDLITKIIKSIKNKWEQAAAVGWLCSSAKNNSYIQMIADLPDTYKLILVNSSVFADAIYLNLKSLMEQYALKKIEALSTQEINENVRVSTEGRFIAGRSSMRPQQVTLAALCDPDSNQQLSLLVHPSRVLTLLFAGYPDGTLLTACMNEKIYLWDTHGQCARIINARRKEGLNAFCISCLAYDMVRSRVIAGAHSGEIRGWNLVTGEEDKTLYHRFPHSINSLIIGTGMNQDILAVGGNKGFFYLSNLKETVDRYQQRINEEDITALAVGNAHPLVAVGGENTITIGRWERALRNFKKMITLTPFYTPYTTSLAFFNKDSLLSVGGKGHRGLSIYKISDQQPFASSVTNTVTNPITSLHVGSDSQCMIRQSKEKIECSFLQLSPVYKDLPLTILLIMGIYNPSLQSFCPKKAKEFYQKYKEKNKIPPYFIKPLDLFFEQKTVESIDDILEELKKERTRS